MKWIAAVVVIAWILASAYIWACFLADQDLRRFRDEAKPDDGPRVRRLQSLYDWHDRGDL